MRHGLPLALAAAVLAAVTAATAAPTPLLSLWFVPDITVKLNGVTVSPREAAVDDLMGNLTRVELGELPEGTRITAFVNIGDGDDLLTFDTTIYFGDFTARAGDVVRLSGSTYHQFLDAAAAGIPDGVLVDALSFAHGESLVMSFDTTVKLGDLTVAPGDLVLYEATSFSMFFDAAAAGVAPGLNLDAAYVNHLGHLFLSFDGSGVIGNPPVTFDDEDVLEYDPESGSWDIAYDGSLQAPEWPPADLKGLLVVAQPETPTPTATSMMATATRTATTPIATASASPPATATATATGPGATATVTATGPPPATATATATGLGATVTATGSPPATATATPTGPGATVTVTATGSPPATVTPGGACPGDCNGDGVVRIDELIVMVNIALQSAPATDCPAGDTNGNGSVTIDEIIAAVVVALGSCPA
jgi:hypothetical protein